MMVNIWAFPLSTQMERLLPREKARTADWIDPKKDMIAVLEYRQGYLRATLACIRNQEDHSRVPEPKPTRPMLHWLALFSGLNTTELWLLGGGSWCKWEELNRVVPL